jgi:uncharacterized protein
MLVALIAAAALHGSGGLPAPDFCVHPTNKIDHLICDDPALLARAKVSIRLYADLRAVDPVDADQAQEGQGWPAILDKCTDRACLLREYDRRIHWIATPFSTDDYRIRGAQRFALRDPPSHKDFWGQLDLLPAGNGLVFFRLSREWVKDSERGIVFSGGSIGFVQLDAGRGSYRDTDKSGFDFERDPSGGWRVIQIGDCPCGAHISLDGLYH